MKTVPSYFPSKAASVWSGLYDRSIGNDAHALRSSLSDIRGTQSNSVTLGLRKEELKYQLYALFEEAGNTGTTEDRLPIGYDTYINAVRFIDLLPLSAPLPDVSMDPDGEVSFGWFGKPGFSFSVSIGSDEIVTYAGVFGSSNSRGAELFHDRIPSVIIDAARRVMA